MYMYSQNYDHTTMHYYMHFYCMITYNLLHVILLHVITILLHTALNVTKSRKQVLALNTRFSVGADRSQPPRGAPRGDTCTCSSYQITIASLLTKGSRTAGHCVKCRCINTEY